MAKKKKAPAVPPTAPRKTRSRTAAAVGSLAVVAGYVFVSGTFTLPPTPAQAAVEDVFAPYFSQQWDVFAPNILRTNSALEVQAQWRDANGELVHSDWVGATDMEEAAVKGSLFPSRVAKNTVNAVGSYITRYDELSDAQQERVQDTFIQRDPAGGFEPIPDEELVDEITALGDENGGDVTRFIRYDYMLGRYTDAFSESYFGEEVERVRWRLRFDRPNDFEQRFDERVKPASYITFGWRQPSGDPTDDISTVFDDVVGRYS